MTPENELKLSFYEEIAPIKQSHNISLIKRIDTNEIFVKKVYENYPSDVFDVLKKNSFDGIPKIYEIIKDDDTEETIVIEEYINGKTLDNILNIEGKLTENHAIYIAVSLCDILSTLHRNDPPLIHRDIKPSNVIINDDGKVHLVDFDASRLFNKSQSRDTELLGTETYAAPEQYGFLQSDERTDIYALGVLIREMITGSAEKKDAACGDLEKVVDKCTSMDPGDRYQSTQALKNELLIHMTSESERTPDTVSYALPGFRSHSIPLKILSALMYLFFISASITYSEPGMSLADLWINRISLLITFLLLTLLYGNYLDIHKTLPLINSSNKIIKFFGYLFYTTSIIFVFGMVTSLADKFL